EAVTRQSAWLRYSSILPDTQTRQWACLRLKTAPLPMTILPLVFGHFWTTPPAFKIRLPARQPYNSTHPETTILQWVLAHCLITRSGTTTQLLVTSPCCSTLLGTVTPR